MKKNLVDILFENEEKKEERGAGLIDINAGPDAILDAAKKLSDPKSTFNQSANPDEVIEFKTGITLAASDLTPTQKEIGTAKSLNDVCTNQWGAIKKILSGGLLGKKPGSPILIFQAGGDNFVLDGHHRWSQFACLVPDKEIVQCAAISAPGVKTPEAALALCHAIIFAIHGKSPTKDWSGENLLKMGKEEIVSLALNLIEKGAGAGQNGDVVEMAKKAGLIGQDGTKEDYAKLLAENAFKMPKPTANSGSGYTRKDMPQVADAGIDITKSDGGQSVVNKGKVEYGPEPFSESISIKRWNKLAGLLKD